MKERIINLIKEALTRDEWLIFAYAYCWDYDNGRLYLEKLEVDAPGTLHHVMIRGLEGKEIFYDDEDRENFLFRVGQLVKRTGDRILAWSLMNNHALC